MSRNLSDFANNSTVAPPSSSSTFHQHACLTMNCTDRLRLIHFPPAVINIVRQAILASWRRGLQGEKMYTSAYEFKLAGNPWRGQGSEAVEARVMMMSILSTLHRQGWHLLASTDVSRRRADKDALIFYIGAPPPATSFFTVSFNEGDKLRLIGAPSELIYAVQQTIGRSQIQDEKWVNSQTAYEFKLRGRPWHADGEEAVTTRTRLLTLLDCFAAFGWHLHASVDMSLHHNGGGIDTWFFRRIHQ